MGTPEMTLGYARRGWYVLPLHHPLTSGQCSCGKPACPSVGKHPRLAHGVYESSIDAETIRTWWCRWPRANVGIGTGLLSGFDVLDVDPRNGGEETLRDLVAEHGPLPETVEQITGGGGRHLFFAYSGAAVDAKLGPGLDVRSDGGLIVAPPSRHGSGREYTWEASSEPGDVEIAPWPAWLLALAGTKTTPRPIRTGAVSGRSIPGGSWAQVLAGCKRLRELADIQRQTGVGYFEWLAIGTVARLGGSDGRSWFRQFTADYPGCTEADLDHAESWLSGNLHGAGTCVGLGCHPGVCGFRPRGDSVPSPLRHAWARSVSVEVA